MNATIRKSLAALFIVAISASTGFAGFIIDHTSTDLSRIPDQWITAVKTDLQIAYSHTSHGSQIITGLNALANFPTYAEKYQWSSSESVNSAVLCLRDQAISSPPDLSQGDTDNDGNGYADWADATYNYLTAIDGEGNYVHDTINVVMWSWCNIAGHDIDRYLASMEWLIGLFSTGGSHARADVLPVQFVFMTAHANGGGEFDSSDTPNRQIRQHCIDNDRILFDFSDIENYNPDNAYFLDKLLNDTLDYDSDNDGSRDANWASEFLATYPGGELDQLTHGEGVEDYSGCSSCAHSDGGGTDARLNCVLKGRAAWTLFACLAGWDGGSGPYPPMSPNGLQLQADSLAGEILVTWQDNSDNEDGFIIEIQVDGEWEVLFTTGPDIVSYLHSGLSDGTYTYRVSAYADDLGRSQPTAADSAVISNLPPESPSNLTSTLDGLEVQLTWQDNSDNEANFTVYQRVDQEEFEAVAVLDPDVTTHTVQNLIPYHDYTFQVTAQNSIGTSNPSNTTTVYVTAEALTVRLQTPDTDVTDAFLQSAAPDTNYGSTQYLSNFDRFIIRFNLPDDVMGKKIISARLGLYVWSVSTDTVGENFNLYRVGQDWTEDDVTWNSAGSDGQGGLTAWATPGGNPQEVAVVMPFTNADNLYDHQYLDEVELQAIVQEWADGTMPNYGLVLDSDTYSFGLKASEYSAGRPYLEIIYTHKIDCVVDFNGDADVDGEDLFQFLVQYSETCLGTMAAHFGESGEEM
ncbi:DNRLRE domain-containing protein [uncultured Desulfobacter sp.]|uniref:DNRLRE domain-containing protein n=1 Tax=uncultured Desulfobacter sp. TaxID=240139 RepID=UPI0029F52D59|nr:DNRLRE domain-containing protein [uncultured Desulfobacter sp.]